MYRSLKIETRYDGSKTVIQHGANSAATPAMNAEIIEAPSSRFIVVYNLTLLIKMALVATTIVETDMKTAARAG